MSRLLLIICFALVSSGAWAQDDGQNKTLFRQKLGEADPVAVVDGDVVSNSSFVTRTRLSPNGRFLTYHKEVNGGWGLYIYDLELNQEKLLVGGAAE